jgi:hypothetical protein
LFLPNPGKTKRENTAGNLRVALKKQGKENKRFIRVARRTRERRKASIR